MVGTGTAANSLSFAAVNRPGGVVMCHREAHVAQDECGAPEFFSNGSKLLVAPTQDGKLTPQAVRAIAETGVDVISVGALTHSASNLDIGLDAA